MIKNINQVLVDRKLFTAEQLEEHKKAAETAQQPLIDYLKAQNLISEAGIAQAYAEQFGIPYLEAVTEKIADPDTLAKVPLKFLRENTVIPLSMEGKITIATTNPTDFQPIDELMMILGGDNQIVVATRTTIIDGINRYYPLEGTKQMISELEEDKELEDMDLGTIGEEDILGGASEAPIIKLVNHILYQAVKRNVSDIHIEPFEKEMSIRYRIDGIMYPAFTPPKRSQAALSSRIKIMGNLNIAEKRIPQDGRIQIKIADKPIDIRVSVLPVSFGERIVLRLLDKSRTFSAIKDLSLSERDLKLLEQTIQQPNGIILITGPTGSGKTSTLYSILSELNSSEVNIITVEDPVEYQMSGISQVQVKEKIGLTFAAALRSILRQDPDIVMIGETRDQETAQIAIQAALTGHLVLSTLHTNSASATITRLLDMGIEPFLIASTVVSVIAQRLVRKLCESCRKQYTPDPEIIKRLGLTTEEASKITFYEPGGCEACLNTGYKGRIAIFEIMVMTPDIARLTIERADTTIIRTQAVKDGMTLLINDGIEKIKLGITSIEEVLAVAASQETIDS